MEQFTHTKLRNQWSLVKTFKTTNDLTLRFDQNDQFEEIIYCDILFELFEFMSYIMLSLGDTNRTIGQSFWRIKILYFPLVIATEYGKYKTESNKEAEY